MDVSLEVIGNNEALGCCRLDEYMLEIDHLRAGVDSLQLLSSELHCAFTDLGLRVGLSLELLLNYSIVELCFKAFPRFEMGIRLVIANGFLHIERVDLLRYAQVGWVHIDHSAIQS